MDGMASAYVRELVVEWGDCDPAGIVYYPRYFSMFNASTGQMLEVAMGCRESEIFRRFGVIGIPMVETRANFKRPSAYGDRLRIHTGLKRFGRSSFEVLHWIFRDETLLAEGYEKRVWAERDPGAAARIVSKPMAPDVVQGLSRFLLKELK
ncbi:4-hydroxybenzoyl-CoA thioesterase [Castellaniella defragrans]